MGSYQCGYKSPLIIKGHKYGYPTYPFMARLTTTHEPPSRP